LYLISQKKSHKMQFKEGHHPFDEGIKRYGRGARAWKMHYVENALRACKTRTHRL
jgi:hypothetical protein